MKINHESYFAWEAQYLVRLAGDAVALRIVNDVFYTTTIKAQNSLKFE